MSRGEQQADRLERLLAQCRRADRWADEHAETAEYEPDPVAKANLEWAASGFWSMTQKVRSSLDDGVPVDRVRDWAAGFAKKLRAELREP